MTVHTKHGQRMKHDHHSQRQPESAFEEAVTTVAQAATARSWLRRSHSRGQRRRLSRRVPLKVVSALSGLVALLLIQGCVTARYDVRVNTDGTAMVSLDMVFNEQAVAFAGSCEVVAEPLTASAAGIPGSELTLDSDGDECRAQLAWNDLAPGHPLLPLLGVSGSPASGWQFTLPAAPDESPGSGGAEGDFGTEGMEEFELVVTAELPGEPDANNAHEVTTEDDTTVFVWRFEGLQGAIAMSTIMPTGATKPAAESGENVPSAEDTPTTTVVSPDTDESMGDEEMADEEPPTTTTEEPEDMATTEEPEDTTDEEVSTTTDAVELEDDEEVPTTTTVAVESSDDGGSTGTIVLIVVAALVAVGGATYWMLRRRSN